MGLWQDLNDPRLGDLVGRAPAHEAGASKSPLATLALVARGSHTEHSASDTITSPDSARRPVDVSEDVMEAPQDGGDLVGASWGGENPFLADDGSHVYDAVVEDEADALPVGEVHWYPTSPRHDTWLERLPRLWPMRVVL